MSGSYQVPTRSVMTDQGAFATLGAQEDIESLARGEDPGQRMDLRAPQAARVAAAVPVLVQVEDRARDVLAEARLAGDRRAALAAQLLDLAVLTPAVDAQLDQAAQRVGRAARSRGWSGG